MTEKEILSQFKKLQGKEIDRDWIASNREVLHAQILAGQDTSANRVKWFSVFGSIFSQEISTAFRQPALVVTAIILTVLSGGYYAGAKISENAKPGDSLYIAKLLNEKARASFTFNEKAKAKLNVEFAGNRVKEITQVLSESDTDKEEQDKHVQELTNSFKKEITEVKNRMEKYDIYASGADNVPANPPVAKSPAIEPKKTADIKKTAEAKKPDAKPVDQIFGANANKDSHGLQLSNPANEAEKLFEAKNFSETLNKLDEVNEIIEQAEDKGEVKGESEQATSTGGK